MFVNKNEDKIYFQNRLSYKAVSSLLVIKMYKKAQAFPTKRKKHTHKDLVNVFQKKKVQ